ncbi:hypothetical protein D3C87_1819460 [compost metagenome]
MQPVSQPVLRVLPVFRSSFQPLIDHATVFLMGDNLAESIFALHRPAFAAGGWKAVKSKAVNAFFF